MKRESDSIGVGYYKDDDGLYVAVSLEGLSALELTEEQLAQLSVLPITQGKSTKKGPDMGNRKGSRKKGRPGRSVGKR